MMMLNSLSDPQELLEKHLRGCAEGRHQDLKKLYELTSANLFSVALRILNDRSLSEDCLQQVFIKVWNHADRYDASKAKARTWLNTIVRNQALDMLRRNRHSDSHEGEDVLQQVEDGADTQEQQVSHWQDSQKLHHCLQEVPEQQRLCLELAYFEGLTHQGLSERIGTSLGTVKTWIRRGLVRLRTCMNSI